MQSITQIRAAKPSVTIAPTDLVVADQATQTVAFTAQEIKEYVKPAPATVNDDGLMSKADKAKLNSVQQGATANSSDAALRARSSHTGTQAISTITNLNERLTTLQDNIDAAGGNSTVINTLVNDVGVLKTDVSALKTTTTSQGNTLTSQGTTLTSHGNTLTSHGTTLTNHGNTLTNHTGRIAALEAGGGGGGGDLTALTARVSALEGAVVDHSNFFGEIADELANHTSRIVALESGGGGGEGGGGWQEARVAQIEQDVQDQAGRISNLEIIPYILPEYVRPRVVRPSEVYNGVVLSYGSIAVSWTAGRIVVVDASDPENPSAEVKNVAAGNFNLISMAGNPYTFIGVNSSGVVSQSTTPFGAGIILLGVALHPNGTSITGNVKTLAAATLSYPKYTLAAMPTASAAAFNGTYIEVTDASGGPKVCRSNGTVWQILNTATTVS